MFWQICWHCSERWSLIECERERGRERVSVSERKRPEEREGEREREAPTHPNPLITVHYVPASRKKPDLKCNPTSLPRRVTHPFFCCRRHCGQTVQYKPSTVQTGNQTMQIITIMYTLTHYLLTKGKNIPQRVNSVSFNPCRLHATAFMSSLCWVWDGIRCTTVVVVVVLFTSTGRREPCLP